MTDMTAPTATITLLRAMVRGAYDLQQLRMQSGLRLCANFRARLGLTTEDLKKKTGGDLSEDLDEPSDETSTEVPDDEEDAAEKAKAKKKKERAIMLIKAEYRRLADGITSEKGRVAMAKLDFTGSAIIGSAAEFALVDSYIALERQEAKQFRDLTGQLEEIPIYREYLRDVAGIGPAMAGVLIAYLNPYRAHRVSGFWSYSGIDVAPDGMGRSRRAEHLVEREYVDRNGETKTKLGVTYNPFLKTKLMGVLGASFLRAKSPRWRPVYDDYKHRLETDPRRKKITVNAWKKAHKAKDPELRNLWTPGRIHTASTRYMIKMFLADLWVKWRTLEGLPVTEPYAVGKLGFPPHGT